MFILLKALVLFLVNAKFIAGLVSGSFIGAAARNKATAFIKAQLDKIKL